MMVLEAIGMMPPEGGNIVESDSLLIVSSLINSATVPKDITVFTGRHYITILSSSLLNIGFMNYNKLPKGLQI